MVKELKSYNTIEWFFTSKFEKLMHSINVCYKNKQRLHLNIGIVLDFENMTIEVEDDTFKICSDRDWFFMTKYERLMYLIKLSYSCKTGFEFDNGIVLNFKTMTIEECN